MIHNFEGKKIVAEKKVSQETLNLYNALDLLNGLGSVEIVVFLDKYKQNVVKDFYANLILTLMILIVLLWVQFM